MGGNQKEQILFSLKRTRKAFIVEYFCGFLILVLVAIMSFTMDLPRIIQYPFIIFGLFALATGEIQRLFLRYKITPTKLIIIHGLIKQKKKNVYFQPLGFVPDINLHQSYFERFFGYGTISLMGESSTSFEVKDVNRPHKIMDIVEELIENNREKHKESKLRKM